MNIKKKTTPKNNIEKEKKQKNKHITITKNKCV